MAAPARSYTSSLSEIWSGLMRRPSNSFDHFGVLSARRLASPTPSVLQSVTSAAAFTAKEARNRLRDFVSGNYTPSSIRSLASHLNGLFMRLESRKYGSAPPTNYLVDTVSHRSIPAAMVDNRLTARGLRRLFGAASAAHRAEAAPVRQRNPEAIPLHNSMLPYLRSAGNGAPFKDWDDLRFMTPVLLAGREYTVQGNKGFFGHPLDHAQDDPEANLAILRRAHAEGKRVVIPARTPEDARAGRLIPGMPILLKEGAVPAEDVASTLEADFLEKEFGEGLQEHYRKLAERAAPEAAATPAANVVSIAEFKAKFARKEKAPEPEPASGFGFGGQADDLDLTNVALRSELDDYGRERLVVWDTKNDAEVALGPHMLPAGTYPKEDGYGLSLGYVRMDEEANITHLDREMRLHNPYGPAFLPAPGSAQKPAFAIEGEPLSAAELRRRRDALHAGPGQPELETPNADSTAFGGVDPAPEPVAAPGMRR